MTKAVLSRPAASPAEGQDPGEQWMFARHAARILCCSERNLPALAARGLISKREIPGAVPRYWRADVEALAARSTIPARADTEQLV